MPTIINGKQILARNDLCASCAVGITSQCVFLEAQNLLYIELEGLGKVLSCKGYKTLGMDAENIDPYDMFEEDDEL